MVFSAILKSRVKTEQNELHFFVNKVDIKFSEVLHFVNKRNNSLLLKILNLDLLSYPYFMTHNQNVKSNGRKCNYV